MREKLKMALVWTRIAVFALIVLYALIVVILNWNAVVDPGLRLMFVKYEKPSAVLTIVLTALVSVVVYQVVLSFIKAVRQLRDMKREQKLASAEQELADIKRKPAMTLANMPAPTPTRTEDPIPLEPAPIGFKSEDPL